MKAIDVDKTVVIGAGKKIVEKAVNKLPTDKSQVANAMIPPEEITKKNRWIERQSSNCF